MRVTTSSGMGAGFFVEGPDRYAYVATANHVVDRGERVLVERDVGTDKDAFVEAYPGDRDRRDRPGRRPRDHPDQERRRIAVLAPHAREEARAGREDPVVRLSRFEPGLRTPASSARTARCCSLVSFPAYDERYARVLRDNAVDGLLISSEIEPGMSGGPTLNDSGEVVGINVTKDRAHVGQNGAVSVVALRALLEARCSPPMRRPSSRPRTSRRCSTRSRASTCCCRSRSAAAFARPTSCTPAICRAAPSWSARSAARSATPTRHSSRSISSRARPRSACSSRGCPASCSRRTAPRRP